MRYVLTISEPEAAAPFRRFVARFADGGELRARGLTAAKLPPEEHARPGDTIFARFCGTGGVHVLTFIMEGGSVEVLCSDLPEIVPASSLIPTTPAKTVSLDYPAI